MPDGSTALSEYIVGDLAKKSVANIVDILILFSLTRKVDSSKRILLYSGAVSRKSELFKRFYVQA